MNLLAILLLNLCPTAHSKVITEEVILQQLTTDIPARAQIEGVKQLQELKHASTKAMFGWQGTIKYDHYKTQEKQLNSFIPVNSPLENAYAGVVKHFSWGMDLELRAQESQYSNNFLKDGTTVRAGAVASLDLWKDFLGRTSKAQLRATDKGRAAAQYIHDMDMHKLKIQVRKLYWAMVANHEQFILSEKLLKASEQQLSEAKKRLRSNIADEAEVSRYQSQLASRKAQILFLNYQKEQLVQKIKEVLPSLQGEALVLGDYNLEKTVNEVLSCTSLMSKFKTAPLGHTLLDEISEQLEEKIKSEKIVAQSGNDIDLKLNLIAEKVGKGIGFGRTLSDFGSESKGAYGLGFSLSFPLDGTQNDVESTQQKMLDSQKKAEVGQYRSKIYAFHDQILRSVDLLKAAVESHQANTRFLTKGLKINRKKFRQARMTLQELLQEEDLLFKSLLDEVATKKVVIETLLDYFTVFNLFPCSFNTRIL